MWGGEGAQRLAQRSAVHDILKCGSNLIIVTSEWILVNGNLMPLVRYKSLIRELHSTELS
jgi:hypothetical protein